MGVAVLGGQRDPGRREVENKRHEPHTAQELSVWARRFVHADQFAASAPFPAPHGWESRFTT